MAVPGGFHTSDIMTIYGGAPLDYQLDHYLAKVGASTSQRTIAETVAHEGHAAVLLPDEIYAILSKNS